MKIRSSLPLLLGFFLMPLWSEAGQREAEALRMSDQLFRQGKYYRSARYAFDAVSGSKAQRADAYAQVTRALSQAGFYHSASYFFIRTMQSGNSNAIRTALRYTESLILTVGLDLFRDYLIRHTHLKQYGPRSKAAYLYALGKRELLSGKEKKAIDYLSGVSKNSALWPFALQLRATAHAIRGQDQAALRDFRRCESKASLTMSGFKNSSRVSRDWSEQRKRQVQDLRNRCQAGVARVLYQMKKFKQADVEYDQIPKASFVWTDILFEQAWTAYSKREFNRTLGKLVSYKSPALGFVHNSEIPVLRALSYLGLCLYADANRVISRSLSDMNVLGKRTRRFLSRNKKNLLPYYRAGRRALQDKLHTNNDFNRLMNRFVRAPYFKNLVDSEQAIESEKQAMVSFARLQRDMSASSKRGFPGFIRLVLDWRAFSIQQLGGAYVRNSLLDYYSSMVRDAENLNFIKIEMLGRFKDKLRFGQVRRDRERGHITPSRRGDQYYWSFNGEFWNDEIGDYVFALDSECRS